MTEGITHRGKGALGAVRSCVRRSWREDKSQPEGIRDAGISGEKQPYQLNKKKNGGGGGSRTPVRKALRTEDYMRSSFIFFRPPRLE